MEERAGEANEVLDNKEGKGVKAKSLSYRNIYGYLASACDFTYARAGLACSYA
jgi:hypothetical protein